MQSCKWTSRGITLLLAVIMVLQLVPKQLFVQAESLQLVPEIPLIQETDESGTLSSSSGEVIGEMTEKRTENVKYFRMSDGSYTAAQYAYDVHYKTDTGYEEYDNTLKIAEMDKVGSIYVPTKSDMQIAFAKDGIGNGIFQFGGEDYSIQVAMVELPDLDLEVMSASAAATLNKQVAATIQAKEIQQYENKLEELTDMGKTVSGLSYTNVLPNTTLDYVVFGNNIKESIILSAPTTQNSWRFKLTLSGVTAQLQENGDIYFVKNDSDEIACIIPKGYMFDAQNHHSDAVTYSLTPCTGGVYLTVHADSAWLNDSSRVYPVTIDPSFWQGSEVNTTVKDAHVIQGNPDLNTRWYSILRTGLDSSSSFQKMRIYLKWNTLPALPNSAEITDARIGIRQVASGQWYSFESTKNYMHLGAYQVLSSWDDSTVTWNNQPSIETNPMDYVTVTAGTAGKKFYFNITTAAREWYDNLSTQQGIVIHAEPERWAGDVGFHSGNDSTVLNTGRPTIMITYRDTRGLENIWSYDVEDVGTAGTGYVNLFNGNLVFVQPGMTTAGNILPLQVGLVYNDFQKGMQFNANDNNVHAPYTVSTPVKTGYGWKLNILETIKTRSTISNMESNDEWLVYNDGNGTEIYFKDYIEIDLLDKYQSEDGHPLTLTKTSSGYVMEDDQHNKKYFDSTGRLFAIEDFVGNRKEIEFNTAGYPIKVNYIPAEEGTAITEFSFEYNANGALVKIVNGRDTTKYMEYLYADTYNGTAQTGASTYLVGVRYSTGEEAAYSYGSNAALIRVQDLTHKNEVWYSYANNRVIEIEAIGDNNSLEDERYITYQDQKTTVRTRGKDDLPLTADDYLNVYLFDEYGRAVNVYVTNLSRETIYGTSYTEYNNGSTQVDIRKQNTIASQTSSGNVAQNLVRNGNAESTALWTSSVTSGGDALVASHPYYGENSFCISFFAIHSNVSGTGTWTQSIYKAQKTGTYTLSAYVYMDGVSSSSETGGVKILLDDESSRCLTGYTDYDIELGWERVAVSRHYAAGETITVTLKLEDSSGVVYFDAIQLEEGPTASAYNLVEDGHFEYGSMVWDVSGGGLSSGVSGIQGNGISITGSLYDVITMPQTVSLNQESKGIAIMVSGWAKGKSAARKGSSNFAENSDYARKNRYFALQVVLNYDSGDPEIHYLDFSPAIWDEWQFVAKAIHPLNPNETITSIIVSPYVGFNKCNAIFDNISVTIAPTTVYKYNSNGYVTETGAANGSSQQMDYTEDNQLSSYQPNIADDAYEYTYYYPGEAFQYQLEVVWCPNGMQIWYDDYDDYGNLLEKHTYSGSDDYEIVDTYTYDYYGNFLQTETTSHGTTTYDYNEATGLLNYVQNANQNRTGYVYDASGKLTAVFLDQDKDNSRDSDEHAVRYVYDSQNRLARIVTQGTSYNFTYNDFDQVTSITLGTSQILLVTYTYNARGGKLIRTDYGDGTYITNTYDDQGRIREVSYNGTKAYTIVYDGNGNVYSYTEEASGHHYLYDYDNIGRIRQYRIMSNNECILLVSYVYQADGRLQSVSREYENGSDYVQYQYNEYGQLEEIFTGLDTRLLFTYDGLDRLSKKSANHGNGQVDTEYTYWTDGNYTSNRITSIKYKTDSQTLKNIQYEYDNVGNITRINDGTETRLYTYDALNQLTSEIVYTNSTGIGTKATYTYDKAGNIVNKTHSVYNNGIVSNSTTTGYTYDEYWRGLLTGYDGEGITYDAIGNPLSYYNGKRYTFSWLYGRRLASAVVDGKTNTYTYNTEGLRLTKNIDNVVHTYYWDGNTLLMEKWGNSFLRFTYDESGAPLRVHYWNGSESIVYYYVLNLQGDVLEIRDAANNVVCRYAYDAWGKLLSIKDGSGNAITSASHIGILNPLRYRGYYYDTETGLYYLQSRYYDPQVGRFVSADAVDVILATPIGLTDKNLYSYCDNNPVAREDENGAFWGIVFDIISFASSVVEVIKNPKDPWAWAGLAGDAIDLLPVVSGVGETTRAVKTTIGVADDIYDASRAIDKVDTAVDTVKTGWHVGDDITNLTKAGNIPSWSTVRKRFWKNEAFYNALDYSADNINRMKKGLAPLVELDGISYSMELHHIIPRRLGGTNDFSNLLKTTPWEHAAIDSYRWFRR